MDPRAGCWRLGMRPGCRTADRHPSAVQLLTEVAREPSELGFYERYFTHPVSKDSDAEKRQRRRFAFFSPGAIATGLLLLMALVGVVAAAIAVTLKRHHALQPPPPSPPSTVLPPSSPIRAALDDNFPDPTIWYNNGVWYAFGTNNAAGILKQPHNATIYEYGVSNVQIATSTDFATWDLLNSTHDPLPTTGAWVVQGHAKIAPQISRANVWAPGLIQRRTDNRFVMYYSANARNVTNPTPHHPPPHCIGTAVSRGQDPAGPYDPAENALVCPVDQGGAIDATAFLDDDGTLYVAWKVDGNNIGHGGLCGNTVKPIMPTPIMIQRMHPDGLTADGDPIQIMSRSNSDGPLVEAPAITKSPNGTYFLFFSSGCTRSPTYDVKYATAKSVTGPYTRASEPLLRTGDYGLLAPGSVGIHRDGKGNYNMAFHARVNATQGRIRAMFTTSLEFDGKTVRVVASNATST